LAKVMDTYSEALLGYRISDTENYLQQYHAFRMAVQNTRRKPYEIVTDNQGGAKTRRMQDFMKSIHQPHSPRDDAKQSAVENHRKRTGSVSAAGIAPAPGFYRTECNGKESRQQAQS
jgi:hypothetical protein